MNEMKSAKRLTALAVVLSTGVLGASSLSDINGHVCGFTGHWNHAGKEGQEIRVEVVTDCETAELVLNKRHLGDRPVDPKTHLATWTVPYEPGTLLARGKIDGRPRIANTLVTAGEPKALRLTPQNKAGEYLVSIVEATDADGVTSPLAANAFTASVTGPATLVAPADGKGRLVDGQSVILVKRTGLGPVGVSVAADGLRGTAAEYGVEKPELTDKSFTFASYNVRAAIACDETPNRWDERAPRLVSVIERNGFDVVGIQEAERCWCEKLVSLLPGWRYCYQGREENGEGESASFIWNAKRFQLVDTDTFWLSATPKTPGSKGVGSACPRTCMWVRLKDLRTGKEFLAFSTHLDFGHKAQFPQMKMIIEKVEELHAKTGLPAFFCGDLNMWAGRPAAEGETNSIVYAREHLKEMWDVSETPHQGNESSWSGFTPRPSRENQYRDPDGRIDHIFLTDGIRVLTSRTHDEYPDGLHPSDHHALSCDVELGARSER